MLRKALFPAILIVIGVLLTLVGFATKQNSAFTLGTTAMVVAGALGLLVVLFTIEHAKRFVTLAVLTALVTILSYANYTSIKGPIDFQNERERRYEHVIQQLKDIRTAELAFKSQFQRYTSSMDTLRNFIETGQLRLVKAVGEVPDTMSLEAAVKAGIAKRDTFFVPVFDSLFGPSKAEGRVRPFQLDSLGKVAFTKDGQFKLEAGFVERSSVKVPVFQAVDGQPFDPNHVLQVGSMTDPKTNGNWE